jgi:transposase
MEGKVKRLHRIWMDGGYRGEDFMRWVMDTFRWLVEIVLRPLEKKGFLHLPKPWVVERTYGKAQLVSALKQGLRKTTRNLRDFHLHRHDSYHGSTAGMIFDLPRLFKHPLRTISTIQRNISITHRIKSSPRYPPSIQIVCNRLTLLFMS